MGPFKESQALNEISKLMLAGKVFSNNDFTLPILKKCVEITCADAGFIFLKDESQIRNKSINKLPTEDDTHKFSQKEKITYSQNIHLKSITLEEEKSSLVNYLIKNKKSISWHIEKKALATNEESTFYEKYITELLNASNTYKIRSCSAFLIQNPQADIEGFIILLNKKASQGITLSSLEYIEKNVIEFSLHDLNLVESICNQMGMALAHHRLVHEMHNVFESFVSASTTAIEARDPSTKGHSERVATLTVALAETMNKTQVGVYGKVNFSKAQIEEIRYASLLHDFGKIGVSEHLLQKEKKLFPYQLEKIEARFNSLQDKIYIHTLENYIEKLMLKNESPQKDDFSKYKQDVLKVSQELNNFWQIILELNEPTVVTKEFADKINEIATTEIMIAGQKTTLLTTDEISALSIKKGSLNLQERAEIESHVKHSYNFLAQIPWSKNLKNIPEIVYDHHERLDGSGYPRKLIAKDIPLQAKMMAITDVYDALVAPDRPYKKGMAPERAFHILEEEVKIGKMDRELFKLFVESRVWELTKQENSEEKVA